MLKDANAAATVAVKDLEVATRFYSETLGLTRVGGQGEEVVVFRSGQSDLNVYRSQYAGSNQATAVTWIVGDELERIVRDLKAKGVRFEHYDLPELTRQGDIHVAADLKVAWFKDPDGNILTLVSD